jgi:hypothetical protein
VNSILYWEKIIFTHKKVKENWMWKKVNGPNGCKESENEKWMDMDTGQMAQIAQMGEGHGRKLVGFLSGLVR